MTAVAGRARVGVKPHLGAVAWSVAQFSTSLRDEVDLEVLGGDLLGVVDQVLAPEHLTLWLSHMVSSD